MCPSDEAEIRTLALLFRSLRLAALGMDVRIYMLTSLIHAPRAGLACRHCGQH